MFRSIASPTLHETGGLRPDTLALWTAPRRQAGGSAHLREVTLRIRKTNNPTSIVIERARPVLQRGQCRERDERRGEAERRDGKRRLERGKQVCRHERCRAAGRDRGEVV